MLILYIFYNIYKNIYIILFILYTVIYIYILQILFAFLFSHLVISDSLLTHGLQPTRFLWPWDFPGKNTGAGCHFFLQRIFPTQGLKLHLQHFRILYHQSHWGQVIENVQVQFCVLYCKLFFVIYFISVIVCIC